MNILQRPFHLQEQTVEGLRTASGIREMGLVVGGPTQTLLAVNGHVSPCFS